MACLTLCTFEPALALLDATEALGAHLDAIVLVGAQAIYLHTGDADSAVAEYTTDADFTISPGELADAPLLGNLLDAAGFTTREHPGGWLSRDGIYVDIMVPEALAGPGTRAARLGPHGKRAARRAKGLEGALVDRARQMITPSTRPTAAKSPRGSLALAPYSSPRSTRSPSESTTTTASATRTRSTVLRLRRATDTEQLANRLRALQKDDLAVSVTTEALEILPRLFGSEQSDGVPWPFALPERRRIQPRSPDH